MLGIKVNYLTPQISNKAQSIGNAIWENLLEYLKTIFKGVLKYDRRYLCNW